MSVFTVIAGASKPASGAGVNAIVAGAGTAAVNGTYTPRGVHDGKPYYNLEGLPDDPTLGAITWYDGAVGWFIFDNLAGDNTYYSNEAVDFPWEVTTWSLSDGIEPAPTVTQG